MHVAEFQEPPGRIDFCPDSKQEEDPIGAVHRCIHAAVHMLEPEAKAAGLPVRFAATKMIENDYLIEKRCSFPMRRSRHFSRLLP